MSKIIVNTFDGHIMDWESPDENVVFEEIADSSELQMHILLTKHFPDWKDTSWWYDYEFDDALWAKIRQIEVDGIIYPNGDPEDNPHPIFKDIEWNTNETYLATIGRTGMLRDEEL